jgi:hypothetical protein
MMRNAIFAGFLACASVLFTASPVLAWDETGHKITAYIAWETMSPQAREQVIKILLAGPEDSDIPAYFISYGSQDRATRERNYFAFMSTWADVIKDRNIESRFRKHSKSNWHYSDTFWAVKDGTITTLPAPDDGGLALEKLVDFDALIRGEAPDAQKAVAIAWIEHLIGDIHQPLHTSARVTDEEKKGDQGGNLFLLTAKGTPRDKQQNLHSFWDSIVVRSSPNSENECDDVYIGPVVRRIMKKYPHAKMTGRLQPGKFDVWIKESLEIAQRDVYSPDLKRYEPAPEKYKKKALKIAEERLALAGYRMGALFEQIFGAK